MCAMKFMKSLSVIHFAACGRGKETSFFFVSFIVFLSIALRPERMDESNEGNETINQAKIRDREEADNLLKRARERAERARERAERAMEEAERAREELNVFIEEFTALGRYHESRNQEEHTTMELTSNDPEPGINRNHNPALSSQPGTKRVMDPENNSFKTFT